MVQDMKTLLALRFVEAWWTNARFGLTNRPLLDLEVGVYRLEPLGQVGFPGHEPKLALEEASRLHSHQLRPRL